MELFTPQLAPPTPIASRVTPGCDSRNLIAESKSPGHFSLSTAPSCCWSKVSCGAPPLSPNPRLSSVRTLIPAPDSCVASPSQTLRSRLHWCSSKTPGPGLPASKYVALRLVPSGAVKSTIRWPHNTVVAHAPAQKTKARKRRENRGTLMGPSRVRPSYRIARSGALAPVSVVMRQRPPVLAQEHLYAEIPHILRLPARIPAEAAARHHQQNKSVVQFVPPAKVERRFVRHRMHRPIVVNLAVQFESLVKCVPRNETDDPLLRPIPRKVVARFKIQIERSLALSHFHRQQKSWSVSRDSFQPCHCRRSGFDLRECGNLPSALALIEKSPLHSRQRVAPAALPRATRARIDIVGNFVCQLNSMAQAEVDVKQ